ncbi:MAG: glycosyltransferase [Flavobacteriales bacterium]|nr:glycosyltransferase [Flavobacteriales bacterium]
MKKVLLFTEWYAPGYKAGGPVQSLLTLVATLKNEYSINIVTGNKEYLSDTPYHGVEPDTWLQAEQNVRIIYLSQKNKNFASIKKIVKEAKPDVVYLNSMYSLYFTIIPALLLKDKTKIKTVLAPRGMLSEGSLSVKPLKKKIFFFIIHILKVFKNTIFHATSKQEETDIRKKFKTNSVCFAPNIPSVPLEKVNSLKKEIEKLNLLTVARIAPEKNILYALEVLSNIQCEIHYTLIGPVYNATYWKECEMKIKQMPKNIQIQFLNALPPAEIEKHYQTNHVFFLPSTGENFGHAIFNSLANGRPVVISDKTPWQAHQEKNGVYSSSLDKQKNFVNTIHHLAAFNQEEFDTLCENSLNFAQAYLEKSESKVKYNQLFGSCTF